MRPTLTSREPAQAGFTLIEATVTMSMLLVVLIASLGLLFTMRNFASKQEVFAQPRQTARMAIDYLSYYFRGAGDMNSNPANGVNDPNALVMTVLNSNTPQPVSFDNVPAGSGYADAGTDILTLSTPNPGGMIPIANWPGWQHAATLSFQFSAGCPNNTTNMNLFQQATGYNPSTGMSGILTLVDKNGQFGYYQITDYHNNGVNDSACSSTPVTLQVGGNAGLSNGVNPPGGQPNLTQPVNLVPVYLMAFRVFGGQLQQKNGFFDATAPGTGFVPLLDNVEDLQIAYIFNDGTIWNTAEQTLPLQTFGAISTAVPPQANPPTNAHDIQNVLGLRVTVVARSPVPVPGTYGTRFSRPPAENGNSPLIGVPDNYYHYRLTATVMLRNRMLGG